ncbi:alpha/beta hydrolase [Thalassotalea psychrophila]|uniref:Alpha/beta hydrolase n=1 Tax=Thalassotalea psychrophila TaxID=3065647 RepID=A0ABY9TTM3_9GAMM|nr:alpha/beta hydrolase [Colwelliaceae bacterium SQ149]
MVNVEKQNSGVFVKGNPNGGAVVMLHSSLSSSSQWRTLETKLADEFLTINIDLLGYGSAPQVENPESYSLNTEYKRIMNVIANVIADRPFHLVGHSLGGANALKIAVQNPNRLLSLNMYEPVAFHLLEQGTIAREEVDDFAKVVASSSDEQAARYFTDTWNRKGFFDNLPVKIRQLMMSDINKVNLDFIGLISEKYTLDVCAKISCPVLLMHGSHSPQISGEVIKRLLSVLPNVTECEILAGHMAPISHAEEVADIIFNTLTIK